MERTTLTLRSKSKWGIRDYINRLSAGRKQVFQSELMAISIAYYMKADWQMTKRRIANRYTVGTQKVIAEYIEVIDPELIDHITQDYINKATV